MPFPKVYVEMFRNPDTNVSVAKAIINGKVFTGSGFSNDEALHNLFKNYEKNG